MTVRSAYRSVLRRGDVLSALVPYVLARLPLTMAPLALLLLTQSETGSYHRAGAVCGLYAVSVAIAGPVLGRLVDRHGQSSVLLVTGLIHPAGLVGAALAAQRGWYALLIVAAIVAGASLPPVAACMRVLWSRLLPDEEARKAGFAIEGVVVEVAELIGPLLISLLLLLGRPALAVAVAGLLMGTAALTFRASHASRSVPRASACTNRWGPLAVRGVRRLLLVVCASTASIGAVEVAITAYARHHGGLASAGLYIGLISAGGIVAGFLFGGSERFGARRRPALLVLTLLLSAGAVVGVASAPTTTVVVLCLLVFGASVAVSVVLQLATMADITTESVRTEAFTWGGTANFIGLGLGTALSGWMLDRYGVSTAFVAAAAPAGLAALVSLVSHSAFTAFEVEAPVDVESVEELAPVVDVTPEPDITPEPDMTPDAAPHPDFAALAEEVAALRAHVTDLENALQSALDAPAMTLEDARERSRRMLERADAACLEMRDRATDDAERVRSAATTAALEIMSAAERDARAMLERARREADGIMARARRTVTADVHSRVTLTALPGGDDQQDQVATGS